MDSARPVDDLKRQLRMLNERVEDGMHDPRVLDVAVQEYRVLTKLAIAEIERLQQTIYMYYSNDRT